MKTNRMSDSQLAQIPLSIPVEEMTRLQLRVVYNGQKEVKTVFARSKEKEEDAIRYFMDPRSWPAMKVKEAEAVPFYLAYIVRKDGFLVDDCIIEQESNLTYMLSDFADSARYRSDRSGFLMVHAISFRGTRFITGVHDIDRRYLSVMGIRV